MSKPLKRHPFIVEFSKDHHYGLLLIWKIREGIKRNIDSERIVQYVKLFRSGLLLHFEEEEKYLLPLLPVTAILHEQVITDHKQLQNQLLLFDDRKYSTYAFLEDFASCLETHIRFEERLFFPHIEKSENFTKASFTGIGLHNHQMNEIDKEWADAFWTR